MRLFNKAMLDNSVLHKLTSLGLVPQIIIAIIAGCLLALVAPEIAQDFSILGAFFVSALKAVAPILVFVLVSSAIANQKNDADVSLKPIVVLYLFGTLMAAFVAVVLSFLFPTSLTLDLAGATANPPQGLLEVFNNLLFKNVRQFYWHPSVGDCIRFCYEEKQ
jgi:serine/threonine transporter